MAAAAVAQSTTSSFRYTFSENSPLAEGKWVRITTGDTGVYEIDYATLAEMGFSDPSKVSVFGNGGQPFHYDFTDINYNLLYSENPKQVQVMHANNKLYFYALGQECVNFSNETYSFRRKERSIYSDKCTYFLTDSATPSVLTTPAVSATDDGVLRSVGYDYLYHELDLRQNATGTGQVYWGESLMDGKELSWTLDLPLAVRGKNPDGSNLFHMMECGVYLAPGDGNVTFSIGKEYFETIYMKQSVPGYAYKYYEVTFPEEGDLVAYVNPVDLDRDFAALDFWVVSYRKALGTQMTDAMVQERFTVPTDATVAAGSVGYIDVPAGSTVFDVTDYHNQTILDVNGSKAYFPNGETTHSFVVFDPAKEQKKIGADYAEASKRNLHALQGQGTDFAIITAPQYKDQAERIAELHRVNDGINVVVVTPQELYDEFSYGRPDAIAYRAFAKMLYQNQDRKLRNMLFFGPLYSDYRNVAGVEGRQEGMIAFQQAISTLYEEAAPDMDYFGTCSDYIASITSYPFAKNVEVGIGLLPVTTQLEAELAVKKIKEYMEETAFEWTANESMSVACPGDSNLHDYMANTIRLKMQTYNTLTAGARPAHFTVINERYGYEKASKVFVDQIGRGKLLTHYYGHASLNAFGGSDIFMNVGKIRSLDNPNLGFLFLAGCELSFPDKGIRGIGESAVIESPRGFVGCIFGARSVQSNWNEMLAEFWTRSLYCNYGSLSQPRTEPITIGQAFSMAKTAMRNPTELSYLLVGDPALRVPVATRKIAMTTGPTSTVRPGDLVSVSGTVKDASGKTDATYNGKLVVKMMLPMDSVAYVKDNGYNMYIDYRAMHSNSVEVTVNQGEFSAQIPVPADFDKYQPATSSDPVKNIPLYVSAFDRSKFISAAGYTTLPLAAADAAADPAAVRDETAPALTLTYDTDRHVVDINATDNVALLPGIGSGGVYLEIDGTPISLNSSQDYTASVAAYTASVPVVALADGSHKAKGYVKDLAGNISQTVEITFNKKGKSQLQLTAQSKAAVEGISFRLAGSMPAGLSLVVTDADGERVKTVAVDGSIYLDTEGMTPGVYRAALVHESELGASVYSNWEEFSVLD